LLGKIIDAAKNEQQCLVFLNAILKVTHAVVTEARSSPFIVLQGLGGASFRKQKVPNHNRCFVISLKQEN
jgi:hypothetical protein